MTKLEKAERLALHYAEQIAELENQIADIKANCDLAIEGRDIKIKELELELTVQKDQHQEEINLHLHAEEYIKSLEKENAELKEALKGKRCNCMTYFNFKDLEKENAELKKKIGIYQKGMYDEIEKRDKKLTKAKELLNEFMRISKASDEDFEHDYSELIRETEQFLNKE